MNLASSRSVLLLLFVSLFVFATGQAAEEAKEEKGVWIERPNGSYLNLFIEENHLQVRFYDKEKKQIEPDVAGASARLESKVRDGRETIRLLPKEDEEGVFLTSPRFIRPPYQYRITLILTLDEATEETEIHSLFFQQTEVGAEEKESDGYRSTNDVPDPDSTTDSW